MTQITFDALEQAFAPIEELSIGESTFDVNGVPVTLRVLMPEEETEVQKFASANLSKEESEGDTEAGGGRAMEFLERFKLSVLSYAIVAVGDQDLRDVRLVETGEVLANKQPVKIPRHEAMRKLILRWGGTMRLGLYRKYTELLISLEEKAEKAIEFKPSDLDAEIDRVQKLLDQLKAAKTQGQEQLQTQFSELVKSSAEAETEQSEEARASRDVARARAAGVDVRPEKEAPEPEEAPTPAEEPPEAPPAVRQPIIPQSAPPPAPAVPQAPPAPAPEPAAVPTATGDMPVKTPFDQMQDSFVGGDLEDEVAQANRALLSRHLGRDEAPVPQDQPESALTAAHQAIAARRPPHLDAVDAREALQQQEAESMAELERMERPPQVGTVKVGDKEAPVFKLPGESLDTKPQAPPKDDQLKVNPTKGSGTGNPRFVKRDNPLT